MVVVAGMLHIALVVLVVGGVAKLRRQAPTVEALDRAELANSRWLVLALGVGEVLVGSIGLVATVGTAAVAWLLPLTLGASAVLYAGFFWFLGRLVQVSPDAGCGCFGASSGTTGAVHRWLNLAFAMVLGAGAAVSAVSAPADSSADGSLVSTVVSDPLSTVVRETLGSFAIAVPYGALVAIGATLAIAVPSALAELSLARRPFGAETVPTFTLTSESWR